MADPQGGPAPVPAASAGSDGQIAQSDLLVIKTGSLALQVAVDRRQPRSGRSEDRRARRLRQRIAAPGRRRGRRRDRHLPDPGGPLGRRRDRAPRPRPRRSSSEQTQTDEVTGQVLDLGARIVNLQATERALQAIMDKAIKISDVLDVQAQLTDVRGQIEQLETEKKHLEEQAAYGTLDVTFGIETVGGRRGPEGLRPGRRGRSGHGQPRRDRPGARRGRDLVRRSCGCRSCS